MRYFFSILLFLCSCKKTNNNAVSIIQIPPIIQPKLLEIKGVDASFLPEIRAVGIQTKNENGITEDMLTTFKKSGVNTIRIRLWKNPSNIRSSFDEVKTFAQEVKNAGLKVWLCLHYSDTWADPGNQQKPAQWANANFNHLKDSVYKYTKQVVSQISADYVQIGNEINNGFLWPDGSNANNNFQFVELVKQGVKAVRENSANTKIMLHFAGHENASYFFNQFMNVDYDIISLSYYPLWHGKNLDNLSSSINIIGSQFNKQVVIAETSYPFTFDYNDFTNNVIGSNNQILSEFSASPDGQKNYLLKIKTLIKNTPKGIGFCYWGGDWISMYGSTSTNGSSWENQALWDFSNKSLPAMKAFEN